MQLLRTLEKQCERALEEYKEFERAQWITAAGRTRLRPKLLKGYHKECAEIARDLLERLPKAKYEGEKDAITSRVATFNGALPLKSLFGEALNTDSINPFQARLQKYLQRGEA